MTHKEKEKIIQKIQKVLNLAGNNPSEAEVQTALNKAQELALKYNLSLDSIQSDQYGGLDPEIMDEEFEFATKTQTVPYWKSSLLGIIAKNFRVTTYFRKGWGHSSMFIIGAKEDVEVFKQVAAFTLIMFEKLFKSYLLYHKTIVAPHKVFDRGDSIRVRNDYLLGFQKGLEESFQKNVTSHAIVLKQHKAVITYVEAKRFRRGGAASISTARSSDARNAGYQDGRSINRTRKGLNS